MDQEEKVRTRILQKAFSLFLSRGFTRVTTQDIASALGISKKTLYKYYRSKHEIVSTAIERNLEGLGVRIDEIVQNSEWGFNEKFTRILMLIHKQVSSISEIFLEDMIRHIPDVWAKIESFRKARVFGVLHVLMREGQAEGAVRNELDLDAVLFLLFGTINNGITPERLLQAGFPLEKIFSTLVDLFYKGLLTPQGAAEFDQNKDVLPPKELGNEEKFFIV
ncbi:MAG: TetR/AcrR family transcriptional regulator [Spirochaetota bacterium]